MALCKIGSIGRLLILARIFFQFQLSLSEMDMTDPTLFEDEGNWDLPDANRGCPDQISQVLEGEIPENVGDENGEPVKIIDPRTNTPFNNNGTASFYLIHPSGNPYFNDSEGTPIKLAIENRPYILQYLDGDGIRLFQIDPLTGIPHLVDPRNGNLIYNTTGWRPYIKHPDTRKPIIEPESGKPYFIGPPTAAPGRIYLITYVGNLYGSIRIYDAEGVPSLVDPNTGEIQVETPGKPVVNASISPKPDANGKNQLLDSSGTPITDPQTGKPFLIDSCKSGGRPCLVDQKLEPIIDATSNSSLLVDAKTGIIYSIDHLSGVPSPVNRVNGIPVQDDPSTANLVNPNSGKPTLISPKSNRTSWIPLIDPESGIAYLIDPSILGGGAIVINSAGRLYMFDTRGVPILIDPLTGQALINPITDKPFVGDSYVPSKDLRTQNPHFLNPDTGKPIRNNATGRLFIGKLENGKLQVVHPNSQKLLVDPQANNKPILFAASKLYAVDPYTGYPYEIDGSTGFPFLINASSPTHEPLLDPENQQPYVIDPTPNRAYVIHGKNQKLYVIDANAKIREVNPMTGTAKSSPAPINPLPHSSGHNIKIVADPEKPTVPLRTPVHIKYVFDISAEFPILVDDRDPKKFLLDPSLRKPIFLDAITGKDYFVDALTGMPYLVHDDTLRCYRIRPGTGKPPLDTSGSPLLDPNVRAQVITDPLNGNSLIDPCTGSPYLIDLVTKKPFMTSGKPPKPYLVDRSSSRIYVNVPSAKQGNISDVDPRTGMLRPVNPVTGKPFTELDSNPNPAELAKCKADCNFADIGSGIYCPGIKTNFKVALRCCAMQGLTLLDLEKVRQLGDAISEVVSSEKLEHGVWVNGPNSHGMRECYSLQRSNSSKAGKNCTGTFHVMCDGGDHNAMFPDLNKICGEPRRFENHTDKLTSLKLAKLPYKMATRCCRRIEKNIVSLDANDAPEDEIKAFLNEDEKLDYRFWHKRQQGSCRIIESGMTLQDEHCGEVNSVLCSGLWKASNTDSEDTKICNAVDYTTFFHGLAAVSATDIYVHRTTAEHCCKQNGFNSLLSFHDLTAVEAFLDLNRVEPGVPYHAYTKTDEKGNFYYAQNDKIPNTTLTWTTRDYGMKPGECLYIVVELEDHERVLRYLSGSCKALKPFTCMNENSDDTIPCDVTSFYDGLEDKRQEPPAARHFYILEEDRLLQKMSSILSVDGWSLPAKNPIWSYKLIMRTFEVYRRFVPTNVVPNGFLNMTLMLFVELDARYGTQGRVDLVTESDYHRINNILSQCEEKATAVPFIFNRCRNMVVGLMQNNSSENGTYFCPERGFWYNQYTTDPIFHTTQNVFQTVRNLCFPVFVNESSKMLHKWQLGINDCFAPVLKHRWIYQVEPMEFWAKILGAYFDVKVRNTDAIALGVYEMSKPYGVKYPRGITPSFRMKGF